MLSALAGAAAAEYLPQIPLRLDRPCHVYMQFSSEQQASGSLHNLPRMCPGSGFYPDAVTDRQAHFSTQATVPPVAVRPGNTTDTLQFR